MTAKPNHYIPKDDLVWNPMRNLPRNSQCLCNSGRKFKVCCLNNLPNAVTKPQAAAAYAAMRVLAEHGKAKK